MTRSRAGALLGLLRLLFLAAVFLIAGGKTPGAVQAADEPADNYVVVQYDNGVSVQAQSLDAQAPSLVDLGYRQVAVPPGKTKDEFLAELRDDPHVKSAVPDAPVYGMALPNDPLYIQNQASYMNMIGAPAAWDLATGGSTVVVAVLDSGIDLNHEEFVDRLWENPRDAASDGIDADGNGCINDRFGCRFLDDKLAPDRFQACGYTTTQPTGDVRDDHGRPGSDRHSHGTLVSGIIGAAGNNGKGITGVAWNVKLMSVKVLDCGPAMPGSPNGTEPSGSMMQVALGIDYARRMGANIINLSLASAPGSKLADMPILRDAIAAANQAGIIIVAATGNDGQSTPGYPAAYTQYPNVIAVGATDEQGNWAPYSNYGAAVDFAAPGNYIASTVRSDLAPSRPYAADRGTSFSAPLVTGMFALMMSRNSRLSMQDYIQIARDAANPAPAASHGQPWAGAGIINIGNAVARVPVTMTGYALKDWRDLPPGTQVKALIGNAECGSSTTVSPTPAIPRAFYNLRIKTDLEQNGCGLIGRSIQLTIAGVPVSGTIPWPARNEDAGLGNRDITTVSPPPGALVIQQLNGDWSNVAHLDAGGSLPSALNAFPPSWTAVLRWDPDKPLLDLTGAFRRFYRGAPAYTADLGTIQTYDAIWVQGSQGNVATGNPNPPSGRTITLEQGWNNFTWTGNAAAVQDALLGLDGKYTQVLQYDNANKIWLSYLPGQPRYLNDFGGLFKLKVYWIYMTTTATVTMK
jgi:subtilisin family serine protease